MYSTVRDICVINHCDRRITLLNDIDISFGLFNLFTYFDTNVCLLGDSKQHCKGKGNFEDICNRTKNISKSPR